MSALLSIPLALAAAAPFPEPIMTLVQNCLSDAIEHNDTSKMRTELKYICGGSTADALWQHLDLLKIKHFVQHPEGEGRWDTMEFPLGGCFKQVEQADGKPGTGLSCTVWIPSAEIDESKPARLPLVTDK